MSDILAPKVRKLVAIALTANKTVNVNLLARTLRQDFPTYKLSRLKNLVLEEVGNQGGVASWD